MFNLISRASKRALRVLLVLSTAGLAAFAAASPESHSTPRPQGHAPIGVMGDHIHSKGEFMFSYRYMHMNMEGNRDGTSRLSPQEIATSALNSFAGSPMQPPTLRVVPTEMTMDMHMLGMMYAPSDDITLMLMTSYQRKKMKHLTFMGPSGANVLGEFETETKGFGDTSASALVRLNDALHLTAGLSLPTGSVKESDQILTPMNTTPSLRLPYPMQLGSGSYDPIIGLTYAQSATCLSWGAQWRSVYRFWDNSEDYKLGSEHKFSIWTGYQLSQNLSVSGRLAFMKRGNINGMDQNIRAPVQTADPDRHGLERLDAALGLNLLMPGSKHRLALEIAAPLHQDLSGPQMETDWTATIGWQYAP